MAALSEQTGGLAGLRDLSPAKILDLGTAFFGSKVLLSAVELDVFTELAREPASVENLSRRIGLHPRGAADFLDALVALKMLDRREGVYYDTPATLAFLDRRKPTYVGGLLEMLNTRLYRYWEGFTQALRTGQPQNEIAEGKDLFELHCNDRKWLCAFMRAMTGASMGASRALARRFPWRNYRTFADIGPGQGCVPVQVAIAHPHLRGIGFDLPPVGPIFNEYVSSFGLEKRLHFQAGDFFHDALPAADVLILGHILHGLSLAQRRELIGAAFRALPQRGALIVMESLIDDGRRDNAAALLTSLNMLIETREGADFTGVECREWMREASFGETWVQPLDGAESMAVGIK